MTKEEYREQLDTPMWDKLRKKILQRDKFTCKGCGAKDCMLHVHHTYYTVGAKAWEYPMKALITMCQTCHSKLHENKKLKDFLRPRVVKNIKYLPYVEPTGVVKEKKIKKVKPKYHTKPKASANLEKARNKRIRKRKERTRK